MKENAAAMEADSKERRTNKTILFLFHTASVLMERIPRNGASCAIDYKRQLLVPLARVNPITYDPIGIRKW